MAALYIAKSLGVSLSTAAGYRQDAERFGFIQIKRYRRALSDQELAIAVANDSELLQRLRRQRGRVMIDGIHGVRTADGLTFTKMRIRGKKKISTTRLRCLQAPRMGYMQFLDNHNLPTTPLKSEQQLKNKNFSSSDPSVNNPFGLLANAG